MFPDLTEYGSRRKTTINGNFPFWLFQVRVFFGDFCKPNSEIQQTFLAQSYASLINGC